jgi:hypothetical protein
VTPVINAFFNFFSPAVQRHPCHNPINIPFFGQDLQDQQDFLSLCQLPEEAVRKQSALFLAVLCVLSAAGGWVQAGLSVDYPRL